MPNVPLFHNKVLQFCLPLGYRPLDWRVYLPTGVTYHRLHKTTSSAKKVQVRQKRSIYDIENKVFWHKLYRVLETQLDRKIDLATVHYDRGRTEKSLDLAPSI